LHINEVLSLAGAPEKVQQLITSLLKWRPDERLSASDALKAEFLAEPHFDYFKTPQAEFPATGKLSTQMPLPATLHLVSDINFKVKYYYINIHNFGGIIPLKYKAI